MIPVTHAFVLALGSSLAASIVAKATVVTALGLIGARLGRRNHAAARHVVLAATFAVLILLPVISIVAPPVHIVVPVVGRTDTVFRPPAGGINPAPSLAAPHTHSAVTPLVSRSSRLSLSRLLITVWLAGVPLCLIPMVVGLWNLNPA